MRPGTFLSLFAAALCCAAGAAGAAPMQVSSTAFADGGTMPTVHAGACAGQNMSPPIAWSNLPAGAKSVALFMVDPDGAKGLGVNHWVAYNIPAERGALKQGEGQADGPGITIGKNITGAVGYRGMCPPPGDAPHHYVVTVVATDLAPGTLPPALTREELLAALKGHALGGQSIVGRFGL
jgi:Raf kinase inhibitor-like YbhB/YbcL family protein